MSIDLEKLTQAMREEDLCWDDLPSRVRLFLPPDADDSDAAVKELCEAIRAHPSYGDLKSDPIKEVLREKGIWGAE